jgi:hypothetical protein
LEFIASGAVTANGGFQLQLSGISAQTYILQASTDLVNWIPIITNTPTVSPFIVIDMNATNFPQRFYRALPQP